MSANSEAFVSTLTGWMSQSGEVFIDYYVLWQASGPSWYFVTSLDSLERLLVRAEPRAVLTAIRGRQLPLRGEVNDDFIARAKELVPDGEPYFFCDPVEYPETALRVEHGSGWSHDELVKGLGSFRGRTVWFGPEPDPVEVRIPDETVIFEKP